MEYIRFKDVTINTQYGYTASETSQTEGVYKYLRITDIVQYFVDFEKVPFCEIPDKQVPKYLIKEGDILVARTGATTGYNYVVPAGVKKSVYASYLIRFEVDKNLVLPLFMKYVLKSQSYYGFVNNYIGGSAQPGMNAKVFGKFNIPKHTLPTQQKIASILSTYDTLIENNTKRIKLLEQMAENLYKEWFVRFRFPGHENVEMENGLPKGWKNCKVKEIYDTSSGGTPSRSKLEYFEGGNIPWIKTGELQDCLIYKTEEKITDDAVKHSSAKMIPSNSLVMAMYGVNIGKLGITTIESTCNQACCVFKEKKYKSSRFYLFHTKINCAVFGYYGVI